MKGTNIKLIRKLIIKLTELSRISKQLIMMFVDAILIVMVLLGAFSLSLNYWYLPKEVLLQIIGVAPFLAIPIFYSFRLYSSVTRYIGTGTFWSIAQAVTLYAVVWGLFSLMSNHPFIMSVFGITSDPFSANGSYFPGISRSVIFINWMLALIIIACSRLLARWFFNNSIDISSKKSKVIIYGAGSAGRQLALVLRSSKEYKPIAFIDEDKVKIGAYVNNIPVFSDNSIEKLIVKNKVSDILLAIPSLSLKKRKKIIDKLTTFSVHVRSLPSVSELAEGKVKINDLLEIDIGDLLGRELVQPNENLLKVNITNKVVLVTGAGGSIGSELCRQILLLKPKQLILFEVSESSLYFINQELKDLNNFNLEVFLRAERWY